MMKKYILLATIASLLASCSSHKIITVSNPNLTEKEQDGIENNLCYSTAGIVGSGAKLMVIEKQKSKEKAKNAFKKQLMEIEGLNISSFKDDNGQEQFKATAQNDILFKFDSYQLNDLSTTMLLSLCDIIVEKKVRIEVIGHTDNIGEKEYNNTLSLMRAKSVGDFLSDNGIDRRNIKVEGKGFSRPVADNKSEDGRAKNRRVEIMLFFPED